MAPSNGKTLSVGIAGLGAVGMVVARRISCGIPGLRLAAASTRDAARTASRLKEYSVDADAVTLAELPGRADIVVEALPAKHFREIAEPAVDAGRIFVPLSVGALLACPDLVDRAVAAGARIVVPTGALIGLDAVRAAAEGEVASIRMITRKPPAGLAGAPYLVEHGISVDRLSGPLKVFDGTAREGARGFPANVNVAAALALAGIGPDRTRLEIWADPAVERNIHTIEVEADSARFSMTIENVPSENPRTGRITALSVVACLRGLVAPLHVGT